MPDGLTKQTYSVNVHLPGSKKILKWHVVAYFSVRLLLFHLTHLTCKLTSLLKGQ